MQHILNKAKLYAWFMNILPMLCLCATASELYISPVDQNAADCSIDSNLNLLANEPKKKRGKKNIK